MIAPLAKLIDWSSIQKNFMRMPAIDKRTLRLDATAAAKRVK
jgi:hypothetical protein